MYLHLLKINKFNENYEDENDSPLKGIYGINKFNQKNMHQFIRKLEKKYLKE